MLVESLYISRKYLDYDKKLVEAQSGIASLFAENESLTIQIFAFANKAKKDKDHLKLLEKNINFEKAFSKLKDKQIDEALIKVEKASFEAVEKFKASNWFSNKLCEYYVDCFELFRKYLAKHHPELDFSQLDMEEMEKEMLEDRPSEVATVDEGMPGLVGSIPTNEVMLGVIKSVPIDLSAYNLPWKNLITFCFVRATTSACVKSCKIEKVTHFTHFDPKKHSNQWV